MTKRRVAIVGTGHRGAGTWGRELLASCGKWVELVGLADVNPLRLAAARAAIGSDAPAFTSLAEMLATTKPDTLIVASRDDTHDEHIVAALEAGVDVVTEKPMATRWQDGLRMVHACDQAGVRLFVVKQNRRNPTIQLLKRAVAEGRFGRIHFGSIGLGFANGFRRELARQIEPRHRGFDRQLDRLFRIQASRDPRLRRRTLPRVARDGSDHPVAMARAVDVVGWHQAAHADAAVRGRDERRAAVDLHRADESLGGVLENLLELAGIAAITTALDGHAHAITVHHAHHLVRR